LNKERPKIESNRKLLLIYVSGLPDLSWHEQQTKMALKISNGHEMHLNFPSQGLQKYTKIGFLV
jgi:hypothetical protein